MYPSAHEKAVKLELSEVEILSDLLFISHQEFSAIYFSISHNSSKGGQI